jgi:hypothetical protein
MNRLPPCRAIADDSAPTRSRQLCVGAASAAMGASDYAAKGTNRIATAFMQ